MDKPASFAGNAPSRRSTLSLGEASPHAYFLSPALMKTTAYFDVMRRRPDRALIEVAWIERGDRGTD